MLSPSHVLQVGPLLAAVLLARPNHLGRQKEDFWPGDEVSPKAPALTLERSDVDDQILEL